MTTGFRLDPKRGIVYAETSGRTSSHDILDAVVSVLDHPSYRSGMRVLLDMRKVIPSLRRSDVLEIAGFVKAHGEKIGSIQLAVVVAQVASFGMAQEQKVALDGSPVVMEVFRDITEAREWLGLDDEDGDE